MTTPPRFKEKVTRRDFLGRLAFGAFFVSVISSFLSLFKFPLMRSFPEPTKIFKIGYPSDFKVGEVANFEKQQLNVFRNEKGFYAISAVCTHLGCLVKYTGQEFKCPCHGSTFDKRGNVKSGPAPRALEWYALSMDSTGQLVVNTNNVVPENTYYYV